MSATAVESPIVTNGHANGVTQDDDIQMNGTSGEAHARFATGLILPPPDIKCEQLIIYHMSMFSSHRKFIF